MAAFPRIEPTRKRGYGLAIQTISMRFSNEGKSFGISEIQRAVEKLREGGFVEVKNGFFVHPTDIGEGLITAITGEDASQHDNLPQLPVRTW
jgi:hypothetical protein